MSSRAPVTFRHIVDSRKRFPTERSLDTFPPERYSDLVRRHGGVLSVPGKLAAEINGGSSSSSSSSSSQKPTKLLLNVNIERSFGPVQVFMSPEDTVRDLMKSAIEIYVKEKRRPLLKETPADPDRFELHYSQFSLESLKPNEKLINLGSRNFFLCPKASTSSSSSTNPSCSGEAKMANSTSFLLTRLMDFLL